MRGRKYISLLTGVLVVISVILAAGILGYAEEGSGTVRKKLRIGYCQAGAYYEFDYQLYQIGMALVESGEFSCDAIGVLSQGDSYSDVWKAMATGSSDYYEFPKECCYDLTTTQFFGLSEEEIGEKLNSLVEENQIDLMITMGTTAGLTVKNYSDVPYMNFLASDPVASGIVSEAQYSGDDRGWAHVNDGVEEKSLAVMEDIFHPKKVGIVYNGEDPEAYIYSGAASVDAYAEQYGVEVVTEYVSDEFEDTEEAYENYYQEMLKAHEKLADQGVDLYILTTSYLELDDFHDVLLPFMKNGIPVFSINSTEDVRCGALAAVEMFDYENVGRFSADILKRYSEGEKLSKLPQQYATAPFLVLNIDSMRETGVTFSLDTLISASRIYDKYEGSEE